MLFRLNLLAARKQSVTQIETRTGRTETDVIT